MTQKWEEEFRGVREEFYPGSTRVRHVNRVPDAPSKDPTAWDANPKEFKVGGVLGEYFGVGALALALERRPGTIRKWEREGVIPKATFRAPSADPRGARRLYSRAQVEGIIRIAHDEGLMNPNLQITLAKSGFTARVKALFEELRDRDR